MKQPEQSNNLGFDASERWTIDVVRWDIPRSKAFKILMDVVQYRTHRSSVGRTVGEGLALTPVRTKSMNE
jgi:hypothetical protein